MVSGLHAFQPAGVLDAQDHQHHPYLRHVRRSWRHDERAQWVWESREDAQWEVVCTECGDTEGPVSKQSVDVRRLRGPYPSRHKALRAAHRHERRENPLLTWTPGSTSRIP